MTLSLFCQVHHACSSSLTLKRVQTLATRHSSLVTRHSSLATRHVQVRCYLRLSDNARARDALRQCLPDALRDNTFSNALKDDPTTKRWLTQLLFNMSQEAGSGAAGAAGAAQPQLAQQQGGPGGLPGGPMQ